MTMSIIEKTPIDTLYRLVNRPAAGFYGLIFIEMCRNEIARRLMAEIKSK